MAVETKPHHLKRTLFFLAILIFLLLGAGLYWQLVSDPLPVAEASGPDCGPACSAACSDLDDDDHYGQYGPWKVDPNITPKFRSPDLCVCQCCDAADIRAFGLRTDAPTATPKPTRPRPVDAAPTAKPTATPKPTRPRPVDAAPAAVTRSVQQPTATGTPTPALTCGPVWVREAATGRTYWSRLADCEHLLINDARLEHVAWGELFSGSWTLTTAPDLRPWALESDRRPLDGVAFVHDGAGAGHIYQVTLVDSRYLQATDSHVGLVDWEALIHGRWSLARRP